MKKQLFLCFILGFFVQGIARSSDMTAIQESLSEAGVKCKVDDDGDVLGHFAMDNDKGYFVWVSKDTFSEKGEMFRQICGQLKKRPKANELTDDQLEWILIENGKNKFGGTVFLYGDDDSTIIVRIPVPANADGTTLKSAMWMCANLLEEVDSKIPEVKPKTDDSPSFSLPDETSEESKTRPKGVSSPTIATDDISDILAKAENHNGIVIGGLYLGMSSGDAKRVFSHLLGAGFGVGDWKISDHNKHYWRYYIGTGGTYIEEGALIAMMVLKRNDKVNAIDMSGAVIRKLIGKKQPVSKERLGRLFFSHFDLDAESDFYDNIKMVTPENEKIEYTKATTKIMWWYELNPPELRP